MASSHLAPANLPSLTKNKAMFHLPHGVESTPVKPGVIIVGAGHAGLLAANMLRRFNPLVYEAQQDLPANHSALLRFRSPSFSDAVGVPFQKVLVRKGIWNGSAIVDRCTVALANQYSLRAVGGFMDRSIWNTDAEFRWIAPPSLNETMARGVRIEYGKEYPLPATHDHVPVISTIPMPVAMRMEMREQVALPEFQHRSIWVMKFTIESPVCNLFQTVYNAGPSRHDSWYRATIHGAEVTVECHSDRHLKGVGLVWESLMTFGMGDEIVFSKPTIKEQKFGKMVPICERTRQAFICRISETLQVYSLGRFATWRPIILDDVVQDVKRIEAMIEQGPYYQRLLASASKK